MDRPSSHRKPPLSGHVRSAADPGSAAGQALRTGPVPSDVQRMLALNGTELPEYFDAELARQVERARRNWPLLRAGDERDEGGSV